MENLILIPGALRSKEEFDKIIPFLKDSYHVHTYEILHHGKLEDAETSFDMNILQEHFKAFLNEIGPSYIYGFGLGGHLALSAAVEDSSNIKGIIVQSTKFDLSTFENVENIAFPVRFIRGAKDDIVNKEEILKIQSKFKNSYYFEIPSMKHSLATISPKNIARLIQVQLESFNYHWAITEYGKIAFRQYGKVENESEPVVLFLHEAIGSIAQWQDFPIKLCKELQLPGIALEFPGYGFSDKEDKVRDENYLHEFALEYLPSFLKAIQIKNPLIIVGHSDGGTNALLYSTQFPKRVHSIITMAAHYINEPQTRAGIQPAIEAYHKGKLKGLEYFHGDKTERLFFAWADTWGLPGFIDWDISKDLKGNAIPALIIQGDNDQYGTDNQVFGIVELLDNAEAAFIKECGHAPHLEKQEEIINSIKKFIGNL